MTLKSVAKIGVTGIAVALTSALLTFQLFAQDRQSHAPNVPLTYTLIAWQVEQLDEETGLQDENATKGEQRLMMGARRSDGSTILATYETTESGESVQVRRILDLANARTSILDSSLKSVTAVSLPAAAVENYRDKRRGCDGQAETTILGYPVVRQTALSGGFRSHGQLRIDSLNAPALGCLTMEKLWIMTLPDGSERTLRSERVVDVQEGEPNEALFNVPPDYTEFSPVERFNARNPGRDGYADAFYSRLEATYTSRRAAID